MNDPENGVRSVVFSTKLQPRTDYLARLAARVLRKRLAALIEERLIEIIKTTPITTEWTPDYDEPGPIRTPTPEELEHTSIWSRRDLLWAPDAAERFLKLATLYENHLTDRERAAWQAIYDRTAIDSAVLVKGEGVRRREWPSGKINRYVKAHWQQIQTVIDGKADARSLPDESERR